MQAYNARKTSLSDIGLKSSLSYSLFLRACTGYAQMVEFKKEDFLCPNCGDSPSYIVCDGKTDGPTKRKVDHLHELDRAEKDESVLCQGSLFQNRVFLSQKRERKLVCRLLTNDISDDEFLESEELSSEHGRMVVTLVERLSCSYQDELPKPYRRFLANISKYSSVAGFLQVLSQQTLEFLAEFCHQQLDIRTAGNSRKLKQVAEELPALWPNIINILDLEKSKFLPEDVSVIILKLIQIRANTFETAAQLKIMFSGMNLARNTKHNFIQTGRFGDTQKSTKSEMLVIVSSVTKLLTSTKTSLMEFSQWGVHAILTLHMVLS